MPVLIRENRAASTVHEPVVLQARHVVPRGIWPKDAEGNFRAYNGVRINDLSELYPLDELRRRCVEGARQWVRHKAGQGYELATAEADVRVYGPYRSRAGTYSGTKQARMTAYSEGEEYNDDLADVVLEALFISTRHRPVQTKTEA